MFLDTLACGVCSTTKDLAAFMSVKDITPAISKCLIKVTLFGINLSNLIECVQELGITFVSPYIQKKYYEEQ